MFLLDYYSSFLRRILPPLETLLNSASAAARSAEDGIPFEIPECRYKPFIYKKLVYVIIHRYFV